MNAKKWVLSLPVIALLLAALLAGFNYVTDPFGAFGDRFLQWFSYDETNNPRAAKISYLEQHHDEYDSYFLGCSSTSSLPTGTFNEMLNAKFYNLIMYGADMKDCEKIANYLIDNYTVKNLVLNVYIDNGLTYDDESNKLTHSLHYKTDPDMSALSYYSRFLFADPRYGAQKLVNEKKDTLLPQSFDVFDEQTGAYDKRVRDVEAIGAAADYLTAYPVFTNYPKREKAHLYKTEDCMSSVAAIRKVCEENGVNLIVLTAPVYTDYYDNFYDEDVTNFYESLAKVTDYWDFSNSSVSSEPRFFYDGTHFRNNVGEMMAARIAERSYPDFDAPVTAMPDDFGFYVTADTQHDYFTRRPAPRSEEDTALSVPVLTWHALSNETTGEAYVTPETFRRQIEALYEAGYSTISLEQLRDYVYKGTPLPENPIVLTFDDGYLSNYEDAFPVLEEYGMKATIFAIGVSIGKDTYKDTGNAMTPHFGAAEMQEMVDSGLISIQSHTYDMHQWPPFEDGSTAVRETLAQLPGESDEDYEAAVKADIQQSKQAIEPITGEKVNALSYPEGAYSTLTMDALRSQGIELTFTTQPGVNRVVQGLPQTLYSMHRITMKEDTDMDAFLAELEK